MRLTDGTLEGEEVDFPQGTLAHVHIDIEAVGLLVVQHKMLQATGHPVLLHRRDVGDHHLACQQGVFAHVLKGTPVHRCALDVHTRAEHDVLAPESELLAHTLAIEGRHLAIPCGCQTSQRRKGHHGIVRPAGHIPSVPLQFLTHTVRAVIHVELADAQTGHSRTGEFALRMQNLHFFVDSHAAERIFHPLLKRCMGVEIDLCCRVVHHHQQEECKKKNFLHESRSFKRFCLL